MEDMRKAESISLTQR